MKSKIFNTDQIRAIQDGRMTQFMQVVKPQPGMHAEFCRYDAIGQALFTDNTTIGCPFGKIGDIIYCRETWFNDGDFQEKPIYIYKAFFPDFPLGSCSWKSPATMPREAARLFLRITNIRVMRVQGIGDTDLFKQGLGDICDCKNPVVPGACENCYNTGFTLPPTIELKQCNHKLWNANSLMWVIDFEKTDKPY